MTNEQAMSMDSTDVLGKGKMIHVPGGTLVAWSDISLCCLARYT